MRSPFDLVLALGFEREFDRELRAPSEECLDILLWALAVSSPSDRPREATTSEALPCRFFEGRVPSGPLCEPKDGPVTELPITSRSLGFDASPLVLFRMTNRLPVLRLARFFCSSSSSEESTAAETGPLAEPTTISVLASLRFLSVRVFHPPPPLPLAVPFTFAFRLDPGEESRSVARGRDGGASDLTDPFFLGLKNAAMPPKRPSDADRFRPGGGGESSRGVGCCG